MKKVSLILGTVLVLIVATFYADRATRVKTKIAATTTVKVDTPTGPAVGTPAPDFTLKDLQGNDVSLSQFKGKVVLIDFWATWCEPCKVEIPWLIELQQKYSAKGFTVLGIAMDEEGNRAVAPFVEKERFDVNGQKFPMSYPIVIGNDDVANKYGGLYGYPTGFLISRDGKQVLKIEGLRGYDEIAKAIESQL
jgi:thiol-disulfide isomerase/thioredoxin